MFKFLKKWAKKSEDDTDMVANIIFYAIAFAGLFLHLLIKLSNIIVPND